MYKRLKLALGLTGCAMAALAGAAAPALAQDIDPKLAAGWEFMQKNMPGVPYQLLVDACAEGTVNVYHGTTTEAVDAQEKGFEALFPCINVSRLQLGTGEQRERFLSEERSGHHVADTIREAEPGVNNQHVAEGLLMNYTISNDDKYPDQLKHSGYWYPWRVAPSGTAWNTDLVTPEEAEKLKTWDGILDPIWKGRAGILDPSVGSSTGLSVFYWYNTYGEDFFKKLGELDLRVIDNSNLGAAALASGDIAVLFGTTESGILPLQSDGAPIEWSLPEPGVGSPSAQAISAGAPHPNAAKLWQEYTFTEEGAAATNLAGPPARIGFADRRSVAALAWYKAPATWYEYDFEDYTKNRFASVDTFKKYIHAGN